MNLQRRIDLLSRLGDYLLVENESYQQVQQHAWAENKWFIPEHISLAGKAIAEKMLNPAILKETCKTYELQEHIAYPKKIGLVMAGNIPYVGLQDLICVLLSGHKAIIKPSSKDTILIKHLVSFLIEIEPAIADWIIFQDMLKQCDAYIATGSDNSARYFEYYFSKFPHIIRKNRTSIAILDGTESEQDLDALSNDVHLFFGLGCRNVTQIWVPESYDFIPLLHALKRFDHYKDHDKYKNNFDYQLTIAIMNNRFYMSNDSIVLIENESPFSPISQLHYQFYSQKEEIPSKIDSAKIQCIVGKGYLPFGTAQEPSLTDFPDGIDTLSFLKTLT